MSWYIYLVRSDFEGFKDILHEANHSLHLDQHYVSRISGEWIKNFPNELALSTKDFFNLPGHLQIEGNVGHFNDHYFDFKKYVETSNMPPSTSAVPPVIWEGTNQNTTIKYLSHSTAPHVGFESEVDTLLRRLSPSVRESIPEIRFDINGGYVPTFYYKNGKKELLFTQSTEPIAWTASEGVLCLTNEADIKPYLGLLKLRHDPIIRDKLYFLNDFGFFRPQDFEKMTSNSWLKERLNIITSQMYQKGK